MVFTKRLRDGVRRGRIRCSVRVWTSPHVKAGGHYAMDDGQIVVDSIARIRLKDITYDLARESGFDHHFTKPIEAERLMELLRAAPRGDVR